MAEDTLVTRASALSANVEHRDAPVVPTVTETAQNNSTIECNHIDSYQGLLALEAPWKELHEHASYPSIYASWQWACTWWRHFGIKSPTNPSSTRLIVVVVKHGDGRWLAVAPLYLERKDGEPLGINRLRLIGDVGRGEAMTEEPAILLRKCHEQSGILSIINYATARNFPAKWDSLRVKLVSPVSNPILTEPLLRPLMSKRVWGLSQTSGPEIVLLPVSWHEYRKSLSRSMKDNLPYYPRRLDKQGMNWSVRFMRRPDEMHEAVDQLVRLHSLRAQATRGTAHWNHLPNHEQLWFLREIMSELAKEGRAYVGLMEVNGLIVAAQAFLEFKQTMTLYYSGFDPDYYDYSPITIIEQRVIQEAIGRGITALNFLPYPTMWKDRWGATSDTLVQELTCSSRSIWSVTREAARRVYRRTKG